MPGNKEQIAPVTPEEFNIAREWLEVNLLKHKIMQLPCKISRKKIKNGKVVGDIDTRHSFVAYPSKDGKGFMLGALPRKGEPGVLGAGDSSVIKEIQWESGNSIHPSKVSILEKRAEAQRIKKTTDMLFKVYKEFPNLERHKSTTDGLVYSKYYVVQPMVGGVTLNNYLLKHKVLSVKESVNLALACVDAISEFHNNGLVHGDVHAGNMILHETKGGIKVNMIDFGSTEEIGKSHDDNFESNLDKDIHCLASILERLPSRCAMLDLSQPFQRLLNDMLQTPLKKGLTMNLVSSTLLDISAKSSHRRSKL